MCSVYDKYKRIPRDCLVNIKLKLRLLCVAPGKKCLFSSEESHEQACVTGEVSAHKRRHTQPCTQLHDNDHVDVHKLQPTSTVHRCARAHSHSDYVHDSDSRTYTQAGSIHTTHASKASVHVESSRSERATDETSNPTNTRWHDKKRCTSHPRSTFTDTGTKGRIIDERHAVGA